MPISPSINAPHFIHASLNNLIQRTLRSREDIAEGHARLITATNNKCNLLVMDFISSYISIRHKQCTQIPNELTHGTREILISHLSQNQKHIANINFILSSEESDSHRICENLRNLLKQ